MKDRLKAIVKYKTNGKQKEFAALMGWSPAYLGKLLAGNNIGLQPVLTVLQAVPEINARWLLLGEGDMFVDDKYGVLRKDSLSHIKAVLEYERFLSVMTPEELDEFEKMVTSHRTPEFGQEARTRWIVQAAERQMDIDSRITEAMRKSDELCKQPTANK